MRRAWRLLDENRKGHIDMEDVKHQGVSPTLLLVFSLVKKWFAHIFEMKKMGRGWIRRV